MVNIDVCVNKLEGIHIHVEGQKMAFTLGYLSGGLNKRLSKKAFGKQI